MAARPWGFDFPGWHFFLLTDSWECLESCPCIRNIDAGPPTQYLVVRDDLPRGFQAAQVAHAAGSFGQHPPETHVVVLSVPDEPALRDLARRLDEAGVDHKLVVEVDVPFDGQATCIGCGLVRDRRPVRKVVSNLPLLH